MERGNPYFNVPNKKALNTIKLVGHQQVLEEKESKDKH